MYLSCCSKASLSHDEGLLTILRENKEYFLALPEGEGVTILLDNGYHQEHLEQEIEKMVPELSRCIKIEIAEKPMAAQRAAAKVEQPAKQGLVVIAKRWIVGRTHAWINQCWVLWKNCEGLLRTSEAKIRICAIRLILRKLA